MLDQLQQRFGFNQFRPGQQQVIEAIMSGNSAAAIFPTGSGKSLCYQLPALALPNLTLVVSPLLALMQDQLTFLQSKGINAAAIDSTLSREQSQQVMQGVHSGEIKILMISVERFNNERFRQFLSRIAISLLVVDEAHCISEWGHNFRPDYLKLPTYQAQFGIPQVLLLTATATQKVIQDMGDKFAIAPEHITTTGFYRPNLQITAKGIESRARDTYLQRWLATKQGQCGIVYVTLQKTAETLSDHLIANGFNACAYHAGMQADRRQQIQQQFMAGEIAVVVATIAFGMGIDKSDIRFVVHYDLPKSIENYAQEIGRAGRDSLPSDCLLMLNSDKLNVLENFVYGDTPEQQDIAVVLQQIQQTQAENTASFQPQWEVKLHSLSSQCNIRLLTLKTLLVYLELTGIVKPTHGYFAEYKFKFLVEPEALIAKFDGERKVFLQAIFDSSISAKLWHTLDLDKLYQQYNCERGRVITALEYLAEKAMIELKSGQITDVYQITQNQFDLHDVSARLFHQFKQKEQTEIQRIQHMLSLFTSDACLTKQLCEYFSDHQLQNQPCGHCSVCLGNIATLPTPPKLTPLSELDSEVLTTEAKAKLAKQSTALLLAKFLCGLTTPIFTRLKMRQLKGFAKLENYCFQEVVDWLNKRN